MKKVGIRHSASILFTVLLSILILLVIPIVAFADVGPKPSVQITFENLGDELCYGTLLSKTDSTGPASAWDGNPSHAKYKELYSYAALDYDNWKAFVEYKDKDGFYFLQEAWQVNETKELAWTYYPPREFKILLYFPERGEFLSSGIYERYAFDSYFTVDMKNQEEGLSAYKLENGNLKANPSYHYGWELFSFTARVFMTMVIELAVAVFFGFREKNQLKLILAVNILTQFLLNVCLNIVNYYSGSMLFVMCYVLLEILVFAVEAVLFCRFLNRFSVKKRTKGFIIVYTLAANTVSFLGGLWISIQLPGIF